MTLTHKLWFQRKILSPAMNESFPDVFYNQFGKQNTRLVYLGGYHDMMTKVFPLRYFFVGLMIIVSRDVQLLTDTKINGLAHMCDVTFDNIFQYLESTVVYRCTFSLKHLQIATNNKDFRKSYVSIIQIDCLINIRRMIHWKPRK